MVCGSIWNDYLLPSLMLGQNGKVKTLPVAVQAFVGSYVKQWDLILTAALLAMIPMIDQYEVFFRPSGMEGKSIFRFLSEYLL